MHEMFKTTNNVAISATTISAATISAATYFPISFLQKLEL